MQGYCKTCGKVVMGTRGDIDVGLAIFLFCCTGGIGFIIYLIVYFLEPEDKCPFCNSKLQPIPQQMPGQNTVDMNVEPPKTKINEPIKSSSSQSEPFGTTIIDKSDSMKKFCPLCGAPLRPGAKFCQTCGVNLENI